MSNGIGKNPLTDISKVYLQQIANESAVPGKPAEKLKTDRNMFNIPKDEQQAAKERVLAKTKKKQMEKGISSAGYTKEGLDPVNPVAVKKKFANRKDRDLDNDGDTDSSDKYLHKRRKAIAGAMKKRMSEGVRDMDPEKGTAERKARLEKKRGMKLDDHPQYKKEEVEVDEAMSSYDRNRKRAAQRAADRNAARAAGKTGVVPGVGYVSPRKERETYVDSAGTTRHKSGAKMAKEGFSNWRTDLSEVMTDDIDSKPVKEKKINNKIKINPKLGEAVEALGGEILEMIEVDEAMMAGPRKDAMAKKINTAKSGSDRATAFNLATRNDMGSSYQKKSTGGKGSRFPGYGDRGAGNKAARRMGKAPMNQGPEKRVTEAVYGGTPAKKEEPKDNRMVVTAADKKGNTPAYQRMKAGDKRYKAADHMKEASFKKIQEKLNLKKTQWGV